MDELRVGAFSRAMVAYRQLAVNTKFWINHHFICNSNVFKYQPAWRNWQTRWTQNPVIARSCGFEPLRRHPSQDFAFSRDKRCDARSVLAFYACVDPRKPQCSVVNGKNGHEGTGKPREFVTTRWSLILSAANLGSDEQKARDALAELCRTYWRPIFSFVRGRGYSTEDAQDLTQDFLVRILKNDWLQHADRNR